MITNPQLIQTIVNRRHVNLTIDGTSNHRLSELITEIELLVQQYVAGCQNDGIDAAAITFTSRKESLLQLDNTEPF